MGNIIRLLESYSRFAHWLRYQLLSLLPERGKSGALSGVFGVCAARKAGATAILVKVTGLLSKRTKHIFFRD